MYELIRNNNWLAWGISISGIALMVVIALW
jgi:hypothetical protein